MWEVAVWMEPLSALCPFCGLADPLKVAEAGEQGGSAWALELGWPGFVPSLCHLFYV